MVTFTSSQPDSTTTDALVTFTSSQPDSTSAISTVSTTEADQVLLYECNFTEPCFAAGQLTITDGSEFNSDDLSEPPRGPSSDVDSIST